MRVLATMMLTALAVLPMNISATVASAPAVTGQLYHRWAIVSDEPLAKSPVGDLLTAELSNVQGIELVERDQIDAALKELKLSQSLADDVRSRLQLGRILKTDALVILSTLAGQPATSLPAVTPTTQPSSSKAATFLKIVIADCRQGARLRTDFVPYEPAQVEETTASILQTVLQTRARFAGGLQKVVGISDFVCRNFTHDYDQYQSGFAYLLENALAGLPGVAVIETEEARAIQRELTLSATAGISRTVPFFVEGTYEIRSDGMPRSAKVQIEIRVSGSDGKTASLQQVDLSPAQAAHWLSVEAPQEITALAGTVAGRAFSPEDQIASLEARAKTFAGIGAFEHSAPLREAILLLKPDDIQQHRALAGEYGTLRWRCFSRAEDLAAKDPTRDRLLSQGIGYFSAGLDHAEYLIRKKAMLLDEGTLQLANAWQGARRIVEVHPQATEAWDVAKRFGRNAASSIWELPLTSKPSSRTAQELQFMREDRYVDYEYHLMKLALTRLRTQEDFDFLLDVLCRIIPETEAPSAAMMNWITMTSSQLADGWTHPPKAMYLSLLEKLRESPRPQNILLGRFGMLQYKASRMIKNRDSTARLDELLEELDALATDAQPYQKRMRSVEGGAPLYARVCALRDLVRDPDRWNKPRVYPRPTSRPVPPDDLAVDRLRFHRITFQLPIQELKAAQQARYANRRGTYKTSHVFNQVLACGDSLDVWWSADNIMLMRTPGVLERLWGSDPYSVGDVAWDGKQIWVATLDDGIRLLTADGRMAARIGADDGLLPADRGLRLHRLSSGKMVAVGNHGPGNRTWCAIIDVEQDRPRIQVFHTATQVDRSALGDGRTAPSLTFEPTWFLECENPHRPGYQMLLLGRRANSPLIVDLDSLQVFAVDEFWHKDYRSAAGSLWDADLREYGLKRSVSNANLSAWVQVLPKQAFEEIPPLKQADILTYRGMLYVVGPPWFQVDPNTNRAQQLTPAGIPRPLSELPYHGVSAHYGLVVWNVRVPDQHCLAYRIEVDGASTQPADSQPAAGTNEPEGDRLSP